MRGPSWRTELRSILHLAVPVVGAHLGMMMMGAVDSMMVGHVSKEALGAVTLGHIYTFGWVILGQGILFALDPLIAQAHGAGNSEGIRAWLQRGVICALLLSVLTVLPFLAAGWFFRLVGQPEELIPTAIGYLYRTAWSIPGFYLFIVFRQTLQAMSIVRPVFVAVVIANLVNAALNYALVYGRYGFPEMGVMGCAWATSFCRWSLAVAIVLLGSSRLARLLWPPSPGLRRWQSYRTLLAIGIPTGAQMGIEMWGFFVASLLMGQLGTLELAGHQIALNLASMSFMVPLGIGAAAATRVGNAIGRGDPAGARLAAQVALATGASVMTLSALCFATIPELLARAFTSERAVIEMAAMLLPIAALFQVVDGTQAVGSGVLRGAADTRVAALVNLIGFWGLSVPLGIYFSQHTSLGPRGVWWGLTVGLFTVALLLLWRIRWRFARPLAPVS